MKHRHSLIAAASLTAIIIAITFAATSSAQQDSKQNPKPQDPQPAAPHEMPPPPGEHHEWLEQLVGTWTVESTMSGPGMPEMKAKGTDTVRSLRGRWVICELQSEMPGMGGPPFAMSAIMSLGYNSETGKYQGTWIDSVHDHLWIYVGTLDPTKKILTLETEGPNMMDPTKGNTKYRDVIEIKSADHRTLTSSALVDGEWVQFVTADYRKTK